MRHFLSPRPVAALARGMGMTAPAGALVTSSGGVEGGASRGLRAPRAAVDIAPVAAAANNHLTATAGTVEQTGSVLHRQLLPMSTGLKMPSEGYCYSGRAIARAGGVVPERLWRSWPVPHLSQRP